MGGGGNYHQIGGTEPGARNLISGNLWNGISLVGAGHRVEGNFIGTDITGTLPLGNGLVGVQITGLGFVTIGGTAPGAGNRIAFNGFGGILVDQSQRITVRGNFMWGHNARGIQLLNGANNNQAAPQLAWADVHGNRLAVAGTLTSAPNTTYTLEFFANPVCHPSGFGEGKQPLGTIQVATNGDGSAAFEALLHGWLTHPLALGRYITATATDPAGNTSEFSQCALNTGVLMPWLPAIPAAPNFSFGHFTNETKPPVPEKKALSGFEGKRNPDKLRTVSQVLADYQRSERWKRRDLTGERPGAVAAVLAREMGMKTTSPLPHLPMPY